MSRLANLLVMAPLLVVGLACEADPNAIESEGSYSPDSLYARIGGERVLRRVVDYYFESAVSDPRLDFTRNNTPHAWEPNPGNVAQLKDRYYTYLSSATAGPGKYQGPPISAVHEHLDITPEQFARSLDLFAAAAQRAGVGPREQQELLTILKHEKPAVLGKNEVPTTQPAKR
ncbi:MAG TPA: group 1 truncated hemoglobin [Tepidisphaeraceae bacterium]|jgi:truncated hemoglobin YjbI|nr:group 1 truncated hemoglobin [Tepidisphaeraceae bacterium]